MMIYHILIELKSSLLREFFNIKSQNKKCRSFLIIKIKLMIMILILLENIYTKIIKVRQEFKRFIKVCINLNQMFLDQLIK